MSKSDTQNPLDLATTAIGLLAEILAAARQQKALFDAYLEAGFTEDHAIFLVGSVLGGVKK